MYQQQYYGAQAAYPYVQASAPATQGAQQQAGQQQQQQQQQQAQQQQQQQQQSQQQVGSSVLYNESLGY